MGCLRELERSEQVAEFKRKVGDESLRDLNVTVLDGRKITLLGSALFRF